MCSAVSGDFVLAARRSVELCRPMRLEPLVGDDPRDIMRALRRALHGAGPALALGAADAGPSDVRAGTAVVVTTSGSTGVPKSVVLSRDALIASAMATSDRIGAGAWLLALPATYVAGMQVLVRAIVADREPALLGGSFTPQAFSAAAATMLSTEHGHRVPTYTSLVPAQLSTLLDASEHDAGVLAALRSFEAILIGGQALPARTLERAQHAGARIVRTYGSTETSGGCVYDGVALRGVSLRLVDDEVQIAGPMLADGYLNDQERTDAAFHRDAHGARWYRAGDAGILEGGVLRVRGRLDNVIVSGGLNISLDRVERIVRSIPGLESAVVVGVSDERWGEASVVVVARDAVMPGADPARVEQALLEKVRRAVAEEIGAHARPRDLVLVEELPVRASGKPDREAIRAVVAGGGRSQGIVG